MKTKKLILTAFFIALGILLPQAFHMLGATGPVFLPMHIPTLLAGFLLGPISGLIVGITTPVLSHFLTHMPQIPVLFLMIMELSLYGLLSGYFYKIRKINIYISLILAMLIGRLASSYSIPLFKIIMPNIKLNSFIYLKTAVITGLIGIAIQLLIIPILVKKLEKVDTYAK